MLKLNFMTKQQSRTQRYQNNIKQKEANPDIWEAGTRKYVAFVVDNNFTIIITWINKLKAHHFNPDWVAILLMYQKWMSDL